MRIGDEGLFVNKDAMDKIRSGNLGRDTKYAIAIYILLCGLASEAGCGTFELDPEYIAAITGMSLGRATSIIFEMAQLGVIMLHGSDATIAYPSEQRKRTAF